MVDQACCQASCAVHSTQQADSATVCSLQSAHHAAGRCPASTLAMTDEKLTIPPSVRITLYEAGALASLGSASLSAAGVAASIALQTVRTKQMMETRAVRAVSE